MSGPYALQSNPRNFLSRVMYPKFGHTVQSSNIYLTSSPGAPKNTFDIHKNHLKNYFYEEKIGGGGKFTETEIFSGRVEFSV